MNCQRPKQILWVFSLPLCFFSLFFLLENFALSRKNPGPNSITNATWKTWHPTDYRVLQVYVCWFCLLVAFSPRWQQRFALGHVLFGRSAFKTTGELVELCEWDTERRRAESGGRRYDWMRTLKDYRLVMGLTELWNRRRRQLRQTPSRMNTPITPSLVD